MNNLQHSEKQTIFSSNSLKNSVASLKYKDSIAKKLETNNSEISEITQNNIVVKLEKLQVYQRDGQYAVYGSTISKLKELHKDLILPIRIDHRTVKECPDCLYKTTHSQSYEMHLKAKHKTLTKADLFFCYHCSYSAFSKNKLVSHMISHQVEKPLECPYCEKMFKGKNGLNSHINRVHMEYYAYHYCDTCSYKSKTSQGLNSHKERTHVPDSDRKDEFCCGLCPFKTNKKWSLQFHIGYKHSKRFTCSTCSFSTPLKGTLKNHVCKLYKCKDCEYKTYSMSHFKIHITRHRNPEELPILRCPFCPFTTTSPSSFYSHKGDHKRNVKVKCPECQSTLKKKSLAAHIKLKHSNGIVVSAWHTCPNCDYKSLNMHNVQRHIECKHTDKSELEVLKCQECNFETKSKGSFCVHKSTYHSEKIHKCNHCNFVTRKRSDFIIHIKIHENRERVDCEKCSKTFLSKTYLKRHFKRLHEKGKSYVCQLCPKDFQHVCKTRTDLRKHMLRHKSKTELETFKCYECPYEAKVKAELARHIMNIHMENKNKYHICTKCYYKTKHKKNLEQHVEEMHKIIKKTRIISK